MAVAGVVVATVEAELAVEETEAVGTALEVLGVCVEEEEEGRGHPLEAVVVVAGVGTRVREAEERAALEVEVMGAEAAVAAATEEVVSVVAVA